MKTRRLVTTAGLAMALAAPAGVAAYAASTPAAGEPAAAPSGAAVTGVAAGGGKAPGGYVTFAWGRSLWANGCNPATPAAGIRTLEQNAKDLKAAGLKGVGGVVVSRATGTRSCERGVTNATWADLNRLRKVYGWSFVSQSMTYARMATLTTDAQRFKETGATLPILAQRGHKQAWGAFFYPDDSQDLPSQQMVAKYFAFGRLYTLEADYNTKAAATTFPYPVLVYTPLGGRCADETLPCHTITVRNNRITHSPDEIVEALNPPAGQWSVIQMFRLVQGKSGTLGQATAWDCTSPDWRKRWTGIPENYCRNSLLTALAARDRTVANVTFADMARTWNRLPTG